MQQTLSKMCADVVMFSREAPSSADYLEAFKLAGKKNILLFPNSSNAVMSAQQAVSMYNASRVTVLETTSVAACYSFLATIDFEDDDLDGLRESFARFAEDFTVVQISKTTKDVEFDGVNIAKDSFFAYHKKEILGVDASLGRVAQRVIKKISLSKEISVVNMFFGKALSENQIEGITANISEAFDDLEIVAIPTEDTVCHITLSLE
jgi:dihydroxyacetone kinase-like predicted kinase